MIFLDDDDFDEIELLEECGDDIDIANTPHMITPDGEVIFLE